MQYVCCTDPESVLESYGVEELRSALEKAMEHYEPQIACAAVRAAASILIRYFIKLLMLCWCSWAVILVVYAEIVGVDHHFRKVVRLKPAYKKVYLQ